MSPELQLQIVTLLVGMSGGVLAWARLRAGQLEEKQRSKVVIDKLAEAHEQNDLNKDTLIQTQFKAQADKLATQERLISEILKPMTDSLTALTAQATAQTAALQTMLAELNAPEKRMGNVVEAIQANSSVFADRLLTAHQVSETNILAAVQRSQDAVVAHITATVVPCPEKEELSV